MPAAAGISHAAAAALLIPDAAALLIAAPAAILVPAAAALLSVASAALLLAGCSWNSGPTVALFFREVDHNTSLFVSSMLTLLH